MSRVIAEMLAAVGMVTGYASRERRVSAGRPTLENSESP